MSAEDALYQSMLSVRIGMAADIREVTGLADEHLAEWAREMASRAGARTTSRTRLRMPPSTNTAGQLTSGPATCHPRAANGSPPRTCETRRCERARAHPRGVRPVRPRRLHMRLGRSLAIPDRAPARQATA